MRPSSFSERLLSRINALEDWLDDAKGRLVLLPARLAGYGLLVGLLMASNLVALCRWPFAALREAWREDGEGPGGDVNDAGGKPIPVDAEGLEALVDSSRPVLLDFWAAWCGPCLMMDEPLRRVARDAGGTCTVGKVNTVKHPEVAEAYGVKGLPTLILFEGGEQVGRHAGALSYAGIRSLVEAHTSAQLTRTNEPGGAA